MGVLDHKNEAKKAKKTLSVAILTVSDTRTAGTDSSGDMAETLLNRAGHTILPRRIIPNVKERILEGLNLHLNAPQTGMIVTIGGTGVRPADLTVDVVRPLLEKELEGYGELFRRLSHDEIGTATILSRSLLGIAKGTIVLSTPGSPKAVRLALEDIVIPELQHLAWDLSRG